MEKVIRVKTKSEDVDFWRKAAEQNAELAKEATQEAEYWKEQAQKNYDDGLRAAGAIAKLMTDAFADRDAAIAEADELRIELMSADERVHILEQRIALLTAQGEGFVS